MKTKDNYTREEIRIAKQMKKMHDKIKKGLIKRYCKDEKEAKELEERYRKRKGI